MMIFVPRNFKPVDGNTVKQVSRHFDADNDGKLSAKELHRAGSTLTFLGQIFSNDGIQNMGTAFSRLGEEVDKGNKAVDADGDKAISYEYKGPWYRMLGWQPPKMEMDNIIGRNDAGKLEVEDLSEPKTNFDSVEGNLVRGVFRLFDSNGDFKLDKAEMGRAVDVLKRLGGLLGNNPVISNLANMFTRLTEELNAGNKAIDSNGDGAIDYDHTVNHTPFVQAFYISELDTMIGRNDRTKLEVADLKETAAPRPLPADLPFTYSAAIAEADTNNDGRASKAELEAYREANRFTEKGNAAAVLADNFGRIIANVPRLAFQPEGYIEGISLNDLSVLASRDGDSKTLTSFELHSIPEVESVEDAKNYQAMIDRWLETSNLNEYGDPKDVNYAGGTPIFDESGRNAYIDRYDYILRNHPNRPWLPVADTVAPIGVVGNDPPVIE